MKGRSGSILPATVPRRGLLLATLFAAQVGGSTGHSIGMAVGGIMAASITGTNAWIGLPVAVGALGAALASWPLSRLMGRFGRRPGLVIGYGLAVAGSVLAMAGVLVSSFVLFLAGMTLFGISNTSNLLARYAAADITPAAHRGRRHGPDRVGLDHRLHPRAEPHGAGGAGGRAAGAIAGGQRVPHQRGRLRAVGDPDRAAAATRSAGDRPPAGGAGGGHDGGAGAPARRHRAGPARAHRLRLADGRPARHDRHHVDLAGLPAQPRARRGHDRAGGGHAPGWHVRGVTAVGVAERSLRARHDDRRSAASSSWSRWPWPASCPATRAAW